MPCVQRYPKPLVARYCFAARTHSFGLGPSEFVRAAKLIYTPDPPPSPFLLLPFLPPGAGPGGGPRRMRDLPPLPRNPVHIRILPLGLLGAYVRLQDGWGTLLGLVTPDRAGPGKARNDGILAHILWLLQGTFLYPCFPRWELASNLPATPLS